jgi:hypothetical protein
MRRSFGTEISGNRRPGAELSEVVRAGIITASEAGLLKPKIAAQSIDGKTTIRSNLY